MFIINTDLIIIDEKFIKDKIYNIRGKQVMIDSDLAEIYGYLVKDFNRQVKNNIERFDDDFMFQLTKEEYHQILRCKNSTLELKQGQYKKYLPYVFTEEGIYMLMTVLKGDLAINQSKSLIRIFKSMKDYLIENRILEQDYINCMVLNHDEDIKLLKETFENLIKKELKNELFFAGKTYDAYSKIIDILNKSKKEIIIIDSYADKKVLDIIRQIKSKVIIITRKNNLLNELDINEYNGQYNNLEVVYDNTFHDRFIIIDNDIFYNIGSSLNHLGKKAFSINIIEENEVKELLKTKINNIIKKVH